MDQARPKFTVRLSLFVLFTAGYATFTPSARAIVTVSGATAISAGSGFSCLVTAAGGVACWGNNGLGQLGDGTTVARKTPTPVVGLETGIVSVTSGGAHSCALTTGGGVLCWGYNLNGELGNNTVSSSELTPVSVVGLSSGVVAIAAGLEHTCAIISSGQAKCWGANIRGQLGDGSQTNRSAPVSVVGLSSVASIAPTVSHTCALTNQGAVKCWGGNVRGMLGNNSFVDSPLPVDVYGLGSGVNAITTGYWHSCAAIGASGVVCWGDGVGGPRGVNTAPTPIAIPGLAGAAKLSAGYFHTCALVSNGVKCWGENDLGQLGNGSMTEREDLPVSVSGLAGGVAAIAAGSYHTCAPIGGRVKCWGLNSGGQLGNNSVISSSVPVDVVELGAEDTPPVRRDMSSTPAPTPAANAVVIAHGYNANAAAGGWVHEMATGVCNYLSANSFVGTPVADNLNLVCSAGGWDVWTADWRTTASAAQNPLPQIIWAFADDIGAAVAKYVALKSYSHVHFIAHSLGSRVIDTATAKLKDGQGTAVSVHATYLDAYDLWASLHPTLSARHVSKFGQRADWSDSYVDTRQLATTGNAVWDAELAAMFPKSRIVAGFLDTTDSYLPAAYNINVTPSAANVGCGMTCRHSRPYRFYGKTIAPGYVGDGSEGVDPVLGTGLSNRGFNLSVEAGRTLAQLKLLQADQECFLETGVCTSPRTSVWRYFPGAVVSTVVDSIVGTVNYVAGAASTLFSYVKLGVGAIVSAPAAIQVNAADVPATEAPASIVVTVNTTGATNTLRFNWKFAAAGEGLLRVFVDEVLVRQLDQRHLSVASVTTEEVYIGGEAGSIAAGTHRIVFRLDGFGSSASGVELTAVQLGLTTVADSSDPPAIVQSAVSRKTHGAAGTFDLALSSVTTNPSTEPRQGPAHTIVVTFDKAVTGGTAVVSEGTATVGTPTFSGNEMRVPLTGVTNQQYVTVAVSNVTAADGATGGSGSIRVGFLAGDVNQSRVVTLADLGQVNAQVAQAVTAVNYLKDVNASGTLSLADKGLTNQQLTKTLPAP